MRFRIVIAVMVFFTLAGNAQQETLIGGSIESSLFGAPVVKMSHIGASTGVLVGGRGGWIINKTLSVGAGGYGLVNNVRARTERPDGERYMNMGYGGLELEYIHNYDELLHYTFYTLIGAGGVNYRGQEHHDDSIDWERIFFVLEPGANFELNVTEFFRFSFGISYRFVTGLNTQITSDDDLRGLNGVLMFKFGKF